MDGHGFCIDDPSKDIFDGAPLSITLFELFDRYGLLAGSSVQVVQGTEDIINAVEEDPANALEGIVVALCSSNEIIHIDLDGMEAGSTRGAKVGVMGSGEVRGAGGVSSKQGSTVLGWGVGNAFQTVERFMQMWSQEATVGNVSNRLSCSAEEWG